MVKNATKEIFFMPVYHVANSSSEYCQLTGRSMQGIDTWHSVCSVLQCVCVLGGGASPCVFTFPPFSSYCMTFDLDIKYAYIGSYTNWNHHLHYLYLDIWLADCGNL